MKIGSVTTFYPLKYPHDFLKTLNNYNALGPAQQQDLIDFLRSL